MYECAEIDALSENSNETCVPWEVDYSIGHQGGIEGTIADCTSKNLGNTCAIRACIIEGWFIQNIFQAFFGGSALDTSLKHTNGFVPNSTLSVKIRGNHCQN